MNEIFRQAMAGAADRVEAEADLTGALESLAELATIEDSRLILEGCIEQLALSDGSVVEVLEAEQIYKDWRAAHSDLLAGQSQAQTGEALAEEIRAAAAMLNNPSMESGLIRNLKRSFHSMALNLKTFGKDLVDLRSKLSAGKVKIAANPVLLTAPNTYRFLSRDDNPVRKVVSSIDEDVKFIADCEAKYQVLFEKASELGKRFREAANSDSNDTIRDAIDYFDENILDRSEFKSLTKYKLLGNRVLYLDKKGYPHIKKNPIAWGFSTKEKDENNLISLLAKKKIHGFSIGGAPKKVRGTAVGLNPVVTKKRVLEQVSATGGETQVSDFIRLVEKTIHLNNRAVKFAQMAANMGEKVQRLSSDMDDAYNSVNTEKSVQENAIRLRELRALHRSARRSVSQYMFMGKALATLMEDHSSYLYRNITLIANDVIKSALKSTE